MRYLFLTNQRKSNKKKIYYIILYFYFVDRGIEPPIAGEPRTPESFRFFFSFMNLNFYCFFAKILVFAIVVHMVSQYHKY